MTSMKRSLYDRFDVLLIPGYLTATHRTPEQVRKLGQLVSGRFCRRICFLIHES
jgi:hypothetical protein